MRGDAKVDQLDVRLFGQQDVVALDIPVHAVVLVQVHQRLHYKQKRKCYSDVFHESAKNIDMKRRLI